jgi:recombination protein RecR
MKYKEGLMLPLADAMFVTAQELKNCDDCGNFDVTDICNICQDPRRDKATICVVETIADLWAIERGNIYKGLYHVLGGTLSAWDNRGPSDLNVIGLERRILASNPKIVEIILATSVTVDGQTTAHYIAEHLKGQEVKFTMLAHGIPVGGELDYLDEGTLSAALKMRSPF